VNNFTFVTSLKILNKRNLFHNKSDS